jgi:hypothetical protein
VLARSAEEFAAAIAEAASAADSPGARMEALTWTRVRRDKFLTDVEAGLSAAGGLS